MRDDIGKLPLSAKAKAYARRTGLGAMKRQPQEFQAVNAEITNPGKPDKFQNDDVGEDTAGKKVGSRNLLHQKVSESARTLVDILLNAD